MGSVPESLTTGQVAKLCRVSAMTVARWVDRGELKAYQLPGRGDRRIDSQDLILFMQKNGFPIPSELQMSSNRVLVVEDDAILGKTMVKLLQGQGYEVMLAEDGFAAGRLVESFMPNVVTVDLRMPGLSGVEVIRRICGDDKFKDIRMLVVSAMPEEFLQEALEAGAHDAVSKPFDNEVLIDKIKQQMQA